MLASSVYSGGLQHLALVLGLFYLGSGVALFAVPAVNRYFEYAKEQ